MKNFNYLTVSIFCLLLVSCGGTGNSDEKNVLIPVATRETYVYVNNKGETMKPEVNVLETSAFYGNYAVVDKKSSDFGTKTKGFIDKSGKLIIPMQYAQVTIFSEGLAFVKKEVDSEVIAINPQGEEVFRLSGAYNARRFSEGLAAFLDNKTRLWGFVDKKGKVIIEPQYGAVGDFSCGLAAASVIGGKLEGMNSDMRFAYGFIDVKGNMVIEQQFDYRHSYENLGHARFTADGYHLVGTRGGQGVINKKGEFVIPPMECYSMQADKGAFVVHFWNQELRNTQAVYMNVKGITLLEGFTRLYPFNGGKYTIALPSDSDEFVIINKSGETVAAIGFPVAGFNTPFIDGMAVAQNGRTVGEGETIINEKGEKIIDEERIYVADDYGPYSDERYFKLNIY